MTLLGPSKAKPGAIWPLHRAPTLNDVLPKLANVYYITIIDSSSGYHKLKLDKNPNSTTFECQFSKYRFSRLPFGVTPAGDMFQREIDEIFKGVPN